ncbi:hypothetical protein XA68_11982 [Ophiocordyceps unilateralis]|uniref:Uncharacterized protein n=1 Tax=Ophiocordyceps unilateralis TaxID=268505 RepID=A0A2A9PN16_OPHUN|nr:hypothetical protein XA68_11982 [Ophiocordyceps unilateralis]
MMTSPVTILVTLLGHVAARAGIAVTADDGKEPNESVANSAIESRAILLGGILMLTLGGAIGGLLFDVIDANLAEDEYGNDLAVMKVQDNVIVIYERLTNDYIRIDANQVLQCARRLQDGLI